MLVDIKDIEKAIRYIKKNCRSYATTIYQSSDKIELLFEDNMSKDCKIVIFNESKKQVPQLIVTSYLPEVGDN